MNLINIIIYTEYVFIIANSLLQYTEVQVVSDTICTRYK